MVNYIIKKLRSITRPLGKACELLHQNWKLFGCVFLVLIIADSFFFTWHTGVLEEWLNMMDLMPEDKQLIWMSGSVLMMIVIGLQLIVGAGLTNATLNVFDGKKANVGCFAMSLGKYAKYGISMVVVQILLCLSLFCIAMVVFAVTTVRGEILYLMVFLVLAICVFALCTYIMSRLLLTPYLVLELNGWKEALKTSWNKTKGHCLRLFVVMVLITIISMIVHSAIHLVMSYLSHDNEAIALLWSLPYVYIGPVVLLTPIVMYRSIVSDDSKEADCDKSPLSVLCIALLLTILSSAVFSYLKYHERAAYFDAIEQLDRLESRLDACRSYEEWSEINEEILKMEKEEGSMFVKKESFDDIDWIDITFRRGSLDIKRFSVQEEMIKKEGMIRYE